MQSPCARVRFCDPFSRFIWSRVDNLSQIASLSAAELRLHPQVVGAIDRLWTAITGYGKFREYTGFIDREQYVLLSIQVSRNALSLAVESCFDHLSFDR